MSAAKYDLGAAGLLGAAVVVFFWPAATLQGAFFVQDVMVQNYPFREFFALHSTLAVLNSGVTLLRFAHSSLKNYEL